MSMPATQQPQAPTILIVAKINALMARQGGDHV